MGPMGPLILCVKSAKIMKNPSSFSSSITIEAIPLPRRVMNELSENETLAAEALVLFDPTPAVKVKKRRYRHPVRRALAVSPGRPTVRFNRLSHKSDAVTKVFKYLLGEDLIGDATDESSQALILALLRRAKMPPQSTDSENRLKDNIKKYLFTLRMGKCKVKKAEFKRAVVRLTEGLPRAEAAALAVASVNTISRYRNPKDEMEIDGDDDEQGELEGRRFDLLFFCFLFQLILHFLPHSVAAFCLPIS